MGELFWDVAVYYGMLDHYVIECVIMGCCVSMGWFKLLCDVGLLWDGVSNYGMGTGYHGILGELLRDAVIVSCQGYRS